MFVPIPYELFSVIATCLDDLSLLRLSQASNDVYRRRRTVDNIVKARLCRSYVATIDLNGCCRIRHVWNDVKDVLIDTADGYLLVVYTANTGMGETNSSESETPNQPPSLHRCMQGSLLHSRDLRARETSDLGGELLPIRWTMPRDR
jgi:hypothetical protein